MRPYSWAPCVTWKQRCGFTWTWALRGVGLATRLRDSRDEDWASIVSDFVSLRRDCLWGWFLASCAQKRGLTPQVSVLWDISQLFWQEYCQILCLHKMKPLNKVLLVALPWKALGVCTCASLLFCHGSQLLKLKVFPGFSFVKFSPVAHKFFNVTLAWFAPEFTAGMTLLIP